MAEWWRLFVVSVVFTLEMARVIDHYVEKFQMWRFNLIVPRHYPNYEEHMG